MQISVYQNTQQEQQLLEAFCYAWGETSYLTIISNFAHSSQNPQKIFYCCDQNASVITSALFCLVTIDFLEVIDIFTLPQYRKLGLADSLFDFMEAFAREAKIKECFLEVARSNESAIALYEKKNFQKFGVRKNYYPNKEDAILYKKSFVPC